MKKIVLIGYMGSGKSSVGKALAKTLKLPFVDLDIFIEAQEKMPISQIFDAKGEIYFRKIERNAIEELLAKDQTSIIALGGGTPCYYNTIDLLNEKAQTIYLRANISTLVSHLSPEKSQRPLIAHLSDEALAEFIAKHLFERSFYYNKAQETVAIDGKSVSELVDEIIPLLSL